MAIPKKPNIDNFIEGAKADHKAKPAAETGDKRLLIKLSQNTWYTAKMRALKQGITLHDYVVKAIDEANKVNLAN